MALYSVLVLDAEKIVRGAISFEQQSDEQALADAARMIDPGVAGKVWEDGRLVGEVRGAQISMLGRNWLSASIRSLPRWTR